ncbi:MAG: hypothetical protein WAK71_11865 [Streptosporangiaceae bacterium]
MIRQRPSLQTSARPAPSVPTATQAAGPAQDTPAGWTKGSACGGPGSTDSRQVPAFHDSAIAWLPPS